MARLSGKHADPVVNLSHGCQHNESSTSTNPHQTGRRDHDKSHQYHVLYQASLEILFTGPGLTSKHNVLASGYGNIA